MAEGVEIGVGGVVCMVFDEAVVGIYERVFVVVERGHAILLFQCGHMTLFTLFT